MKRPFSHIPLPVIRLNDKGKIIGASLKRVEPVPRLVLESRALNLAVKAPFAPIVMLTREQKAQMKPPLFVPSMTPEEIQAFYTAVRSAELVLS